jgi:hypothetical protein
MTGFARPHHLGSRLCGLDPARVAASVTGLNFLTVDTILRKMEQMEIGESATVGIWTVVDAHQNPLCAFQDRVTHLSVEKLSLARFGGRLSCKHDFTFRITEDRFRNLLARFGQYALFQRQAHYGA